MPSIVARTGSAKLTMPGVGSWPTGPYQFSVVISAGTP